MTLSVTQAMMDESESLRGRAGEGDGTVGTVLEFV
jgi:hypothetical protein